MNSLDFIQTYLAEAVKIADTLDRNQIDKMVQNLLKIRNERGRLFVLGVGGSSGNANHAVNDFRKIVNIESYAPTDNVSELTARVNDDGWETVFSNWLKGSHIGNKDGVLVLSVGGGNLEKNVSPNIVSAVKYAKEVGASVMGVVGRDGGYTAKLADACVIVPTVNTKTITPHTEAFQAVVWHLLVSHPDLKVSETKWESVK